MVIDRPIHVLVTTEEGVGVEGLIVQLRVEAGTKNPYYLAFPKTNELGEAQLTPEDLLGQFTDHWEAGLMDHNGTLESADPEVTVSLFDPTWSLENEGLAMAWPLLPHERTKWTSRREEYEYRISCTNPNFDADPFVADLESTRALRVVVSSASPAGAP